MCRQHFTSVIVGVLAALLFLLAGCTNDVHPGQGVSDHGVPAPIILTDTSPTHLSVAIGVTIGGYDATSRDTTEIAIQFLYNGRLVQFTKGETLACNGAKPTALTTGFDQKYPTLTVANTLIACTYTSGHTSGTLQFRIPSGPVILSPIEGASVARSGATLVRFQAQGALSGIVALGIQQKAIAHITEPGVATADTSRFVAGVGSISLSQYPTITGAEAPAFASLQTNCTAIAQTDVTWS